MLCLKSAPRLTPLPHSSSTMSKGPDRGRHAGSMMKSESQAGFYLRNQRGGRLEHRVCRQHHRNHEQAKCALTMSAYTACISIDDALPAYCIEVDPGDLYLRRSYRVRGTAHE